MPSDSHHDHGRFTAALPWLTLPWLIALLLDATRPWIVLIAVLGLSIAVTIVVRPSWMTALIAFQRWLTAMVAAAVGEIALLSVFFLVVIPLGLFQRLRGKTLLPMKPNKEQASYWQAAHKETTPDSFTKRW